MSGNVKVDAKAIEDLKKRIEACAQGTQELMDACLRDLTTELLTRAISMTPRDTSNLARRWTDHTTPPNEMSGKRVDPRQWAAGANISHTGKRSEVTVSNSAAYAPYVEYGHRTRDHRGWVPGFFMLTKAVEQTERMSAGIVERRLEEYLKGKLT